VEATTVLRVREASSYGRLKVPPIEQRLAVRPTVGCGEHEIVGADASGAVAVLQADRLQRLLYTERAVQEV